MAPPKKTTPDESDSTILARIDERTQNIEKNVSELKDETTNRLNDHAVRLRTVELSAAVTNGHAKGRDFSFKRLATWVGIIATTAGAIWTIIKITPQ